MESFIILIGERQRYFVEGVLKEEEWGEGGGLWKGNSNEKELKFDKTLRATFNSTLCAMELCRWSPQLELDDESMRKSVCDSRQSPF